MPKNIALILIVGFSLLTIRLVYIIYSRITKLKSIKIIKENNGIKVEKNKFEKIFLFISSVSIPCLVFYIFFWRIYDNNEIANKELKYLIITGILLVLLYFPVKSFLRNKDFLIEILLDGNIKINNEVVMNKEFDSVNLCKSVNRWGTPVYDISLLLVKDKTIKVANGITKEEAVNLQKLLSETLSLKESRSGAPAGWSN